MPTGGGQAKAEVYQAPALAREGLMCLPGRAQKLTARPTDIPPMLSPNT